MSRNSALLFACVGLGALACTGVGCGPLSGRPKLVVLGFDGMDPQFFGRHVGRLPHLTALARGGGFARLETIMPPQSPVAWSTVITGMGPDGHGIFDFVHRDPERIAPFSSMAQTVPPTWVVDVGPYSFPIGGEVVPLRQGTPFWTVLEDAGVRTSIIRMPTDFPPQPASGGALSGMGTPDMLGTFGTFQFFTDDPDEFVSAEVSGGEIHRVEVAGGRVQTWLLGPHNDRLRDRPRVSLPMSVDVDRDHHTVRIEIDSEVVVLEQGQWSSWVPLSFELIPWVDTPSGIVRFFLKEAGSHFKLYASPINIDPARPEAPISHPEDFSARLAEDVGRFYTQGMAEETKALSAHLISRDEFVQQSHLVFDEEERIYDAMLSRFDEDLLFYYFSVTDQAAHMLWGDFEESLLGVYERADAIVGRTLETIDDDTTLLVMSDHGFARFDKQVHLNKWLLDHGFLALREGAHPSKTPGFVDVDWSATTAYVMGLNGLYLNLEGREAQGIVTPDQIDDLRRRLRAGLLALRDPETHEPIIGELYETRASVEGGHVEFAPDFLVGFMPPYRMSPETGLGAVPSMVVEDNPDEWIGDHCMKHDQVPGVLFSNRPIQAETPSLRDVPVTVLAGFGIDAPPQMEGANVFAPR